VTQTAIAKELGITKQAAGRLIKRGMPTHSVDAAKAWRASNSKGYTKRVDGFENDRGTVHRNAVSKSDPESSAPKLPPLPAQVKPESIEAELVSAREAALMAKDRLREMMQLGKPKEIDSAQRTFQAAQRHRIWMEQRYRDYLREQGITIFMDEALPIFCDAMNTVVRLINTMPRSISPRCTSPDNAVIALEEYCGKVRRTVQGQLDKLKRENSD